MDDEVVSSQGPRTLRVVWWVCLSQVVSNRDWNWLRFVSNRALKHPWSDFSGTSCKKKFAGFQMRLALKNHLLQANIVFFFLNLCVFLFWFCVVRQFREKWNTAAVAKVKPANQRENVVEPVGRDGLQSWRRSFSSLFIFDFTHLLRLSVESGLTPIEQAGEFAAVWIAPRCEELSRAEELKGVWLLTHTCQKCANEPLMHTHITVSSWVSFIIQPCDLFMCLFLSLKMGLFLPLWSVFQISHQESLGTTSLSPMGPY